jgi:hypothetical protein
MPGPIDIKYTNRDNFFPEGNSFTMSYTAMSFTNNSYRNESAFME